eukprot:3923938-Pleurochrysis_carterae.AAC.1
MQPPSALRQAQVQEKYQPEGEVAYGAAFEKRQASHRHRGEVKPHKVALVHVVHCEPARRKSGGGCRKDVAEALLLRGGCAKKSCRVQLACLLPFSPPLRMPRSCCSPSGCVIACTCGAHPQQIDQKLCFKTEAPPESRGHACSRLTQPRFTSTRRPSLHTRGVTTSHLKATEAPAKTRHHKRGPTGKLVHGSRPPEWLLGYDVTSSSARSL